MFGAAAGSGFADLAAYDSNPDGVIDGDDLVWSRLQVWQDLNQDGVTEDGELSGLAKLGTKSISLNAMPDGGQTVEGATLRAVSTLTFEDGSTSGVYEALLPTDETDTVYARESGLAAWQKGVTLNLKGFGRVTQLTAAIANDARVASLEGETDAGAGFVGACTSRRRSPGWRGGRNPRLCETTPHCGASRSAA